VVKVIDPAPRRALSNGPSGVIDLSHLSLADRVTSDYGGWLSGQNR